LTHQSSTSINQCASGNHIGNEGAIALAHTLPKTNLTSLNLECEFHSVQSFTLKNTNLSDDKFDVNAKALLDTCQYLSFFSFPHTRVLGN
jgi:hypothetical protein